MTTPFGYFDLLEAFPKPGCAVCRLLDHDVDRFLDTLLFEYPVDPITQNNFRASRGLCHEHSWRLPGYNNALATAILYNAVLDEMLQISEQAPAEKQTTFARLRGNGTNSALADALAPTRPCPACVVRSDAEKRYLQVLGERIGGERLGEAFRASDGLCLPHFRGVLAVTRDPENARQITMTQRAIWAKLKNELELFLHKSDAHYHEQMGSEANSWLRAIARIAGEKRG
jgi:Family of unknown function (DUF6062)